MRGSIQRYLCVILLMSGGVLFSQEDSATSEARLSQAFMHSWQGKQEVAQQGFIAVLKEHPEHLEALVGLGYSYAWSEKYAHAEKTFKKALEIAPNNMDARKGLAYTYFWRGDKEQAQEQFANLIDEAPQDAEVHVGLGQVHLQRGHYGAARNAFQKALTLDPGRQDAVSALNMLQRLPGRLEVNVWGGNTTYSDDNKLGLRQAEVAFWLNRDVRIWGRFDNALSLDNLGLIQSDEDVPAFYAGGMANWNRRFTTKLEIGRRELPGDVAQTLFNVEQVVHFAGGFALKAGSYIGPREDDRTEWLAYTGVNIPVGNGLRLEPNYYYANITDSDDEQHRFVLNSEFRLQNGISFLPGLLLGHAEAASSSGTIYGGHLMTAAPIGAHTGYFLVRYEDPLQESFWVVALGANLSLFKY